VKTEDNTKDITNERNMLPPKVQMKQNAHHAAAVGAGEAYPKG
jgi:hypothetical protein